LAPEVGLEPTALRLTGGGEETEPMDLLGLSWRRKSFLEHVRRQLCPNLCPGFDVVSRWFGDSNGNYFLSIVRATWPAPKIRTVDLTNYPV